LTSCKNNLRQLGLALVNFHDTQGAYPTGVYAAENFPDDDGYGWGTKLLPYIEESGVYGIIERNYIPGEESVPPWDRPGIFGATRSRLGSFIPGGDTALSVFRCPSSGIPSHVPEGGVNGGYATSDYKACNGWGDRGMFFKVSDGLSGCSDQPAVAPVRGTVLLDGKPLPGGRVMFEPIAEGEDKFVGKAAFGQIQPDGGFVLTTDKDGDGAVVGPHHPVIFGNRVEDDRVENPDRPTEPGPNIGLIRLEDQVLQVVAGDENVFTIELSSRRHLRAAIEDD
jgi:hypothetical protein